MRFETILTFKKEPQPEQPVLESSLAEKESTDISKENLKEIWLKDTVVKHGIDLNTNLINYGLKIYSNDNKVQTDLATIDYFTDLHLFFDKLVRDAMVFGVAFVEFLYNKDKTKIVGLWNMDPVRTDFTRDQQGNVLVDSVGNPLGYVEEIGVMRDVAGATTDASGRRIKKYSPDKVTHFTFEELPGTIEGVSILHAVYNLVKDKWEAEEGVKESIKRFGVPIFVVTVGDERHNVSRESMEKIKEKLVGITKKSVIITPNWQKIELLQPKNISDVAKNLDYYLNQIPIALSIPRALILETGESVNRATLRQQIRLYISKLEKWREKLKKFAIRDLFRTIAEVNGWDQPPEITFKPITLEDVESFAKRVATYVKSEIITPDEVKEVVKRMEDL